jgi:hypothetical protein
MRGQRIPNGVVVTLLVFATLGVFGPHLLILGFQTAGAQPPAALVFMCALHHGVTKAPRTFVGGARATFQP